ncbi:hypothetical protein EDEG_00014 [Edhazardia aedis USNM 41457]|uniref:Uncharacterized protein n=1 Tax=Edhazardia aedis (strain USNM 41457) TaxID=1003232 RepID=J9DHP0_EDHAE|nr:hypothetical protein EDEG_00014 [Edhazardia aedis USNM 41457]|eukprot:EJW02125.1 hypothetical protein EDEG_00014 [Edhazardia aedis USNM 41457]
MFFLLFKVFKARHSVLLISIFFELKFFIIKYNVHVFFYSIFQHGYKLFIKHCFLEKIIHFKSNIITRSFGYNLLKYIILNCSGNIVEHKALVFFQFNFFLFSVSTY